MIEKQKHFPTKEKLHTDMLEEKYWTIIGDVIRHDNFLDNKERIREVRMIDKDNILRTYAITFLTYDKHDKNISDIDEEIRNWWLIWKTFREHNYIVKKNVIDVYIIDIPERIQKDFNTENTKAKARLTEFYTKPKNTEISPVVYGIVCEIYSPDFRNPEDWINKTDLNQINPTTGMLQDYGIARDIIWDRLDKANETNERSDFQEQYDLAKKSSIPVIKNIREKIEKHIKRNNYL